MKQDINIAGPGVTLAYLQHDIKIQAGEKSRVPLKEK
jgi:hypothetical protein